MRRDGEVVRPPCSRGGSARKGGRSVAVVRERDADRQGSRFRQRRRRRAGGGHGEAAALTGREDNIVDAGESRRRLDGEEGGGGRDGPCAIRKDGAILVSIQR